MKKQLGNEREPTRRQQLDIRQQALKLTANSMCAHTSHETSHATTLHGSNHCLFVLALHAKDLTYGALKLIAESTPQAQHLERGVVFSRRYGSLGFLSLALLRAPAGRAGHRAGP